MKYQEEIKRTINLLPDATDGPVLTLRLSRELSVMYLLVSQGYSTVYSKALENIGNF